MTQPPKIERRPKAYPPPEFPPRRPKLFAKTPPAVFPVVLGLLGLGLALRRAADVTGLPETLHDVCARARVSDKSANLSNPSLARIDQSSR